MRQVLKVYIQVSIWIKWCVYRPQADGRDESTGDATCHIQSTAWIALICPLTEQQADMQDTHLYTYVHACIYIGSGINLYCLCCLSVHKL